MPRGFLGEATAFQIDIVVRYLLQEPLLLPPSLSIINAKSACAAALPGGELPGMSDGDIMLLRLPVAIREGRKPGEDDPSHILSPARFMPQLDWPSSVCCLPSVDVNSPFLAVVRSRGRLGRVPLQERECAPNPSAVKGKPHLPQRTKPR